jgi:CRP-like cAMP-binding protein
MGPGDYFGETAMVDPSCIRKAAVECATPCEVLYFSRAVFQQLNMSANIDRIHAEKATILQQTGLFKDLTKEEFQSISQVARYKTFDRNTVVLKQGDMPKYLVILVTGMVKVLQVSQALLCAMPCGGFIPIHPHIHTSFHPSIHPSICGSIPP